MSNRLGDTALETSPSAAEAALQKRATRLLGEARGIVLVMAEGRPYYTDFGEATYRTPDQQDDQQTCAYLSADSRYVYLFTKAVDAQGVDVSGPVNHMGFYRDEELFHSGEYGRRTPSEKLQIAQAIRNTVSFIEAANA
jgi:hypothetical protein